MTFRISAIFPTLLALLPTLGQAQTPALVNAFDASEQVFDGYRILTGPPLAPAPGPQADIRASFGPLAADLPSLKTTDAFGSDLSAAIDRFCAPFRGCNLRDDRGVEALRDRLVQAGYDRPVDFSYKFFAPQHIATLSSQADLYCEIDDDQNLYVFDGDLVLSAVAKVDLTAIWPTTSFWNRVTTGCDMAPDGRLFVSLAESYVSGSDGAVFAFAPGLTRLLWASPHKTSNGGVHFAQGRLFSAHGGTGVPDYLFELDPETGKVIGRNKVRTGIDMIVSEGDRLILSGYDFAQVITLR